MSQVVVVTVKCFKSEVDPPRLVTLLDTFLQKEGYEVLAVIARIEEEKENDVAKCVVCQKREVAHKHVICRICNEREHYGILTPEEEQRLIVELQYRRDQDNSKNQIDRDIKEEKDATLS